METEQLPILVRLETVDQLMYLIQQVTGDPTDEILGFFNDLGKSIVEISVDQLKKQRSIRRTISDYYPNSPIPFEILVTGNKTSYYFDPKTKQQIQKQHFNAHVFVGFPSDGTRQDNDKLMEIVAERALLGGCSLPAFEKPPTKSAKMYKSLMKQIYELHKKENNENICDPGHPRQVGSTEETSSTPGDSGES